MATESVNDPVRDLPGYALRRASSRAMKVLSEALQAGELRPSEASVLVLVLHNAGIAPRQVGATLGIASGNLAPLLQRLASRGYLRRDAEDGRSVRLTLTPRGRSLARRSWSTIVDCEAELIARVPKALRAPFVEALQVLAFGDEDSGS